MDPLSEALISEGIIDEKSLNEIKNRVKGKKSLILEMFNSYSVDEEKIAALFQDKFKIPRADLKEIIPEAIKGFSEKDAMKYMCIPFDKQGRHLKVAMVDPLDFNTIQDVSFITGSSVIPYVATRSEILNAINTCYEISTELTTFMDNVLPDVDDSIEFIEEDNGVSTTDVFQSGLRMDIEEDNALSAPAIKLVNLLLKEAVQNRASDIHIEPGQKGVEVRFRIDGVLKTHMDLPRWIHPPLVSRLKIMSKLDISNRRTPQDGSIKAKIEGKSIDLRISTLPTHLGEKVVIRLLNPEESNIDLRSTGLEEKEYNKLKKLFTKPQGIILVTGPTGSGKTTTLHGILKEIYSEEVNIITVEDPVEYELKGITQVQVNEKAGLTFANTLRSILRQDPDVVMVGEIRDLETAEIAFRASMTGHLVLSTLHTNDTVSTITRLIDLGVEPYLVGSSLLGIIAQRLVRVNCQYCVEEYIPKEEHLCMLPYIKRDIKFMKGKGCDKCSYTGYRGRAAVFEIMEITPSLREMISKGASETDLKKVAKEEGMLTLYESALKKVYKGITTVEEVLRVIPLEGIEERKCLNCGRKFTGDSCPYCGASDEQTCSKCGNNLEPSWKFCPFCGSNRHFEVSALTSKPRVLIVDDEIGIQKMVEIALRPLEVETYTAGNGKEALDKIHQFNPNLIITDINMPIMDGFELIKQVRAHVNTMFIPIIILSSRDSVEDKLKGFTYGTDDYLTKPFDYTELQARVRRLLQRTYS